MDKEHSRRIVAMCIKENSDVIRNTERENTNGQMEKGIRETGSIITRKVMGHTITKIKISIKDSTRTI